MQTCVGLDGSARMGSTTTTSSWCFMTSATRSALQSDLSFMILALVAGLSRVRKSVTTMLRMENARSTAAVVQGVVQILRIARANRGHFLANALSGIAMLQGFAVKSLQVLSKKSLRSIQKKQKKNNNNMLTKKNKNKNKQTKKKKKKTLVCVVKVSVLLAVQCKLFKCTQLFVNCSRPLVATMRR